MLAKATYGTLRVSTGFDAHGGAGGDIEAKTTGCSAVEGEFSGDDDEQCFLFARGGELHGTGLERGDERQRSAEGECGGGANPAVLVEHENPNGGQGQEGQADFQ